MSRFEMNRIKGVIPAMMTFFDKEENVDTECTRRMVEFMLEHGADGFYLTGSTGECFTMTMEERNLVVDTVIDQVKGRVPVVVHVGDIGTKKSIELAEHAYRAGADAISSVPPFYWKFRAGDIIITGIYRSPPLFRWWSIIFSWQDLWIWTCFCSWQDFPMSMGLSIRPDPTMKWDSSRKHWARIS